MSKDKRLFDAFVDFVASRPGSLLYDKALDGARVIFGPECNDLGAAVAELRVALIPRGIDWDDESIRMLLIDFSGVYHALEKHPVREVQ